MCSGKTSISFWRTSDYKCVNNSSSQENLWLKSDVWFKGRWTLGAALQSTIELVECTSIKINTTTTITTMVTIPMIATTSAGSYHTCPTPLGSLSTFEVVHGPHHYWRIKCLSRVWSGTTLCRTPVQLLCSSNSTYSTGSLGQPGGGSRLPKPR